MLLLVLLFVLVPAIGGADPIQFAAGSSYSASRYSEGLRLITDNLDYRGFVQVEPFDVPMLYCDHSGYECRPGDTVKAFLSKTLRSSSSDTPSAFFYLSGSAPFNARIEMPIDYRLGVDGRGVEGSTILTASFVPLAGDTWAFDSAYCDLATAVPVPEPASLVLLGVGLLGARRKR